MFASPSLLLQQLYFALLSMAAARPATAPTASRPSFCKQCKFYWLIFTGNKCKPI